MKTINDGMNNGRGWDNAHHCACGRMKKTLFRFHPSPLPHPHDDHKGALFFIRLSH
jgi:hypothetical protein